MNTLKQKLQRKTPSQKKAKHNISTAQSNRPSSFHLNNSSFDIFMNSKPHTPKNSQKKVKQANTARKKSSKDQNCAFYVDTHRYLETKKKNVGKKLNGTTDEKKKKSQLEKKIKYKNVSFTDQKQFIVDVDDLRNDDLCLQTPKSLNYDCKEENKNLKQKLLESYQKAQEIIEQNHKEIRKIKFQHQQQQGLKIKEIFNLQDQLAKEAEMISELEKGVHEKEEEMNQLIEKLSAKDEQLEGISKRIEEYEDEKKVYLRQIIKSQARIIELKEKVTTIEDKNKQLQNNLEKEKADKQKIKKNAQDVLSFVREQYEKEKESISTTKRILQETN